MAIQDSFNLSKATTSQAYAYKCWYNYNYGGNTMKISAKDMGELTQTWSGELKNWRATASNDENAYEIDDDDFSTAKANGADSAKDKTGYSGNDTGNIVNNSLSSAASIASFTMGSISAGGIGNFVGGSTKIFQKGGIGSFGKAASTKTAENGAKTSSGKSASASAYVAAALAIATAAAYKVKKPNKTEKEACDELKNTMNDAQASLQMAQSDMETAGNEIVDLSDEAQTYNEDANSDIEDKKTEYDMYKASYDALMEKAKSGEPLSEDEKALLKELVPLMQQLGIDIGDLSDETTDKVGDIYAQMGDYQETYDNAASTMGEVEGVTDYAESFDGTTRTMCIVETASQGLNAVNGASAGARLMGMGFWNWALGAASIVAGAFSAVAAVEQGKMASDIGDEIDARKITQDLNSGTTDLYDENIDIYAGQMEGVEDLELEIPEEMEAPEDVMSQLTGDTETVLAQSAPASGTNSGAITTGTTNGGTTPGTVADDKDKDKKV